MFRLGLLDPSRLPRACSIDALPYWTFAIAAGISLTLLMITTSLPVFLSVLGGFVSFAILANSDNSAGLGLLAAALLLAYIYVCWKYWKAPSWRLHMAMGLFGLLWVSAGLVSATGLILAD